MRINELLENAKTRNGLLNAIFENARYLDKDLLKALVQELAGLLLDNELNVNDELLENLKEYHSYLIEE